MWIEIITIVISVIAIFLACQSNRTSEVSNKISKEAIDISKETAMYQMRPWLTLSIPKINSAKYLIFTNKNNVINSKFIIRIENQGYSPAVDIRPEKVLVTFCDSSFEMNTSLSDHIFLGPGKTYDYVIENQITVKGDNTAEEKFKSIEDSDSNVNVDITIFYKSIINLSKEFKTQSVFKIKQLSVSILTGSELT